MIKKVWLVEQTWPWNGVTWTLVTAATKKVKAEELRQKLQRTTHDPSNEFATRIRKLKVF